jgi:hypothetical protein
MRLSQTGFGLAANKNFAAEIFCQCAHNCFMQPDEISIPMVPRAVSSPAYITVGDLHIGSNRAGD